MTLTDSCPGMQGSGAHQHLLSSGDHSKDGGCPEGQPGSGQPKEALQNVGLVVWQSAFVLAELLVSHPPFGTWQDVRVVDLGTGTGLCHICSQQLYIRSWTNPWLPCNNGQAWHKSMHGRIAGEGLGGPILDW
jgi:hypothetical protein